MQSTRRIKADSFASDVLEGLSASPKFLSSKYFYDDEGSRLFQEIMKLPEYYLTGAEFEIFSTQAKEIYQAFTDSENDGNEIKSFDLIELGAGDGTKTAVLIDYFLKRNADFTYIPIDISAEAQRRLTESFRAKFSGLSVQAEVGDYFEILETLKDVSRKPKILLFLGSNIGNFSRAESIEFFKNLSVVMDRKDLLFIGFDLQKDPRTILRAYDDSRGITARFNLNLLTRINRELGGDFNLENFSHYAVYRPVECAARSFLISRKRQTVCIAALNRSFEFKAWEPIFMEISQKYNLEMIDELASESGFRVIRNFFDSRNFYADSLWKINA
ncbi:MAG TPA: L-histidine N(alpha)-methyltransferase [Pyrinomonadaceae bacterium]|jgi:dimethylhistidine N-methyltransferase